MQVANPLPNTTPSAGTPTLSPFLSDLEFRLAIAVLVFGVVVLAAQFWVMKRGTSAEEVLKGFALTLIIIGTLFLIVAGYSNNQIAPAVGLFGTLAGSCLSGCFSKPQGVGVLPRLGPRRRISLCTV
jgi:hypothetical protein